MSSSIVVQAMMVDVLYRTYVNLYIYIYIYFPGASYTLFSHFYFLIGVLYWLLPVIGISQWGTCVRFYLSVVYLLPYLEVISWNFAGGFLVLVCLIFYPVRICNPFYFCLSMNMELLVPGFSMHLLTPMPLVLLFMLFILMELLIYPGLIILCL